MLKVMIGVGVSVRVVNEERVIPFLTCFGVEGVVSGFDGGDVDVVRTTTEWGRWRIRCRRVVERGGSCVGVILEGEGEGERDGEEVVEWDLLAFRKEVDDLEFVSIPQISSLSLECERKEIVRLFGILEDEEATQHLELIAFKR